MALQNACHPAVFRAAAAYRAGSLSRREFLCRATALGVSAGFAGLLSGTRAATQELARPQSGGAMRIQMEVLDIGDPRTFDLSEKANIARGLVEYLVEVRRDGGFRGRLLESWQVNEDATEYQLNIRPGVSWNTGEAFTAEDVAANFAGWADTSVSGNSMAARVASLVDPASGQLIDDALEIVDPLTLKIVLPVSDITLIPSLSDYPAAIQHRDLIGQDPAEHGVGTGAYTISQLQPGVSAELQRNTDHAYWGDAFLDTVSYIDLGADPAVWVAAAQADEFDVNYDSVGDFVSVFDAIGWQRSEIVTAATIVIRTHQNAELGGMQPYADPRVRQALALAVDNQVLLELGYGGRGTVAENHHVSPIQPEYAALPALQKDVAEARRLMEEAGMLDFEHELISVDDDWRRFTADACAAQLRDAGFQVRRRTVPSTEFWQNWTTYPFSATNWAGREFGVQTLALAYRSNAAWNETGFSNAEFDAVLSDALALPDADLRREQSRRLQEILREQAVIIQPYWRAVYRHAKPNVLNAERHQKDEINPHHLGWSVLPQTD